MIDRYHTNFTSLSQPQASLLARALQLLDDSEDALTVTGADLFEMCTHASIDQATVVMALASDRSVLACSTVETLLGRPIRQCARGESAFDPLTGRLRDETTSSRTRTPRTRTDPRILTAVQQPNPKREGTASHARYQLYETGRTVTDLLSLGLTPADIRHDEGRGHITLEVQK